LVYFCLIFVAMATPLASLKIQVAYLNLTTLHTSLYMQKKSSISCRELKFVQFWPKFGCHSNFLIFLEISGSILNIVQFWLIFV